jgi:hypothetical protein
MRIEDWLAVFDFRGQAADRHRIPSFALGDGTGRRDNAIFALGPFPSFSLCATHFQNLHGRQINSEDYIHA